MESWPFNPRHFRWASRNLFGLLSVLAGVLLLVPPFWLAKAGSFFTLGSWLVATGAWLILSRSPERHTPLIIGLPLIAVLLTQGLSVLWSYDPTASLNPFSLNLSFFLFFLTAFVTARSAKAIRPGVTALVAVAVVLALYGIYQHLAGLLDTLQVVFQGTGPKGTLEQALASRLASRRAFSLFTYPNLFAGFLAMLLPLSAGLAVTTRRPLGRWGWSAASLVLATALFVTGSLGGWLAAGLGLGLLAWGIRPRAEGVPQTQRLGWLLLALLVVGAGVMIWIRGPAAVLNDLSVRWANWGSSLHMGWHHGLTGVGPGLFGTLFPEYQSPDGYYIRHAHNFWLQRFAETGWPGLLAWIGLLAAACWNVAKKWQTRTGRTGLWVTALSGAALAGVVHATLDVDFEFLKTGLVFWLVLGTLLGLLHVRPSTTPREETPSTMLNRSIRWGLCLLGALVLWRGGRSLPVEGLLIWGTGGLLVLFFRNPIPGPAGWGAWLESIPLRWNLSLLFVWGVLAALVSLHPEAAIPGLTLAAVGLLLWVMTVKTSWAGLYIVPGLILSAVALGAVAMVESFLHPGSRATAGWPNPNLLASFLAMGGLASAAFWAGGSPNPLRRWVAGICTVFLLLALLTTGSIGGVLNAVAGLSLIVVWVFHRQPNRFKGLVASGVGLLLVFFLLPTTTSQRFSSWVQDHGAFYERVQMANSALKMVWDRPVTGQGPGNFSQAFERFSFPNMRGLSRYGMVAEFAHNEFLQMAAVMGIPGFLLLLWVLWGVATIFRRQWRQSLPRPGSPEALEEHYRLAAWAALTGTAAQGMVDFNWHLPAILIWAILLLGVALSPAWDWRSFQATQPASSRSWFQRLDSGGSRIIVVLFIFIITAAATAGIRPLVSRYLISLAEAHRYKNDLKASARQLEQALVVHPFSAQAYDQLGQVRTDYYASMGLDNWFQLAEWAFRRALVLDRLDPYIHRHLGRLYGFRAARLEGSSREQMVDQAERQYVLATEKSPHKAFLYFELGNVLRDANRLGEAERAWQEAVRLEPHYAAAWSNLGVVQEIQGNPVQAEVSYRTAIALQDLRPQAQGKYEIELLALPGVVIHTNLAHLLETQSRPAEARAEYRQILRLEPGHPLAQQRLKILEKITP